MTGWASIASLFLASIPIFAADPTRVAYTCKEDDFQFAGMTCSEEHPCPIYIDFSGIASAGQNVVLAGNIHSAQATLYSVLLASDDAGQTWREPVARARGEELDQAQFFTLATGWVSGQRVAPLPSDPFLLVTRDGGKSWRRQPVLAEGSPGFVQAFRFTSATDGKLMVNRGAREGDELQYQLYESTSGGDTWTIRETSAAPMAHAPAAPSDPLWRVRAEPGGKVLAVEHLSGGKWTAAARFAIELESCKGDSALN